MSRFATRLLAAGLTLLVIAGLALGARCMSLTSVSCSVETLFSDQPELDVPYAGTRPEVVDRMLEMALVGPNDRVFDLGTGDGRILIAAARDRGASGLGVDLDPVLIKRARRSAEREDVADRVSFQVQDLFDTPLRGADVVTMFLLPEVNLRLRPRILSQMRPGTRVVSHAFDMGEWQPTATDRVGGSTIYLWIVPARVEGRWRLEQVGGEAAELSFRQRFDTLEGQLSMDGRQTPLEAPRLAGDRISFSVAGPSGDRLYVGRVEGDSISGENWRAVRK